MTVTEADAVERGTGPSAKKSVHYESGISRVLLPEYLSQRTGVSDNVVPAGMWVTLKCLILLPVFFTVIVCLNNHISTLLSLDFNIQYLRALEVSGIIQQQLTRRHNDIGRQCLEGVHKPSTLLRHSL